MRIEKRIKLQEFLSKRAINTFNNVSLNLNNTFSQLEKTDFFEKINLSLLTDTERNNSNCYRIIGNINIVASNVLFNLTGDNSNEDLVELRDFDDEVGIFSNSLDEVLFEDDGWFYYKTGNTCSRVYLEPVPDRFTLFDNKNLNNWDLLLTYPATGNVVDIKFNNVSLDDGLGVYDAIPIILEERNMTAFIVAVKHNFQIGDEIELFSPDGVNVGFEGNYKVYSIGMDGAYHDNIFVIDKEFMTYPSVLNTGLGVKKKYENYDCKYYSRWFKPLTSPLDVEFHNQAFATNYFNDEIFSFKFNKDIDIEELKDIQNVPLTSIYLTKIKKTKDNTENLTLDFFTSIKSGIYNILRGADFDINSIDDIINTQSIETNIKFSNEYIFGDIVEYNPVLFTETVLEESYHRFNTINRRDNSYLEGYFYKAHTEIKLKEISEFLEISLDNNDSYPTYAKTLEDGRVVWRDILPNSFSNLYPFVNNCHYIYLTDALYVKRQDPCNDNNQMMIVSGVCETYENFEEIKINEC